MSVSARLWHGRWQHEKINVLDHLYVSSEIKNKKVLHFRGEKYPQALPDILFKLGPILPRPWGHQHGLRYSPCSGAPHILRETADKQRNAKGIFVLIRQAFHPDRNFHEDFLRRCEGQEAEFWKKSYPEKEVTSVVCKRISLWKGLGHETVVAHVVRGKVWAGRRGLGHEGSPMPG